MIASNIQDAGDIADGIDCSRRHYGLGRKRSSIARRSFCTASLQHMCASGTLPVIALQTCVHTGSSGALASGTSRPMARSLWAACPLEVDGEESASSQVARHIGGSLFQDCVGRLGPPAVPSMLAPKISQLTLGTTSDVYNYACFLFQHSIRGRGTAMRRIEHDHGGDMPDLAGWYGILWASSVADKPSTPPFREKAS